MNKILKNERRYADGYAVGIAPCHVSDPRHRGAGAMPTA